MKAYLTRIQELQRVLEHNGYHSFQIQTIIHECIGRRDLSALTESEIANVIECLEEYIDFSQKCTRNKK